MDYLNRVVVALLPYVPRPLVRHFAGKYIAGESLDDAVRCVRQLNKEGICATLDVLGEDITKQEEAVHSRNQSIEVLHAIAKEKLDSNLSIKLTSLGLKLGNDVCTGNVREILKVAESYGTFVRFDMEDSTCTADTISIFRTLNREFPKTGIVLQAYMRRSEEDVRTLVADKTNFRLCKGIYKEPEAIAFQGRAEVQQNYLNLLRMMIEGGSYVGIATHDTVLVDGARKILHELRLPRDRYEFQMLLGVRPELRKSLVREGHKVRLYIPFGGNWYGYSMRRFKENPEIAGYVFKSVFTSNN